MNHRPTNKLGRDEPPPSRASHILALLGREIGGFFQRLRLTTDRAYQGSLHILLFLVKSARFSASVVRRSWRAIRSFARQVWRFLVFLAAQMRAGLRALVEAISRARRTARTWIAWVRDAFQQTRLVLAWVLGGIRRFLTALVVNVRYLARRILPARRGKVDEWTGEPPFLAQVSSEVFSKNLRRLQSFLVKEVLDVVQQPRLVITLVLGPFLILLIFGLGFTGKQGPATTVIVLPPDAEFPLDLEEQLTRYQGFMPIYAIVDNREEALTLLKAREVEIVAVLPAHSNRTVLSGQQAVIEIHVDEYDPVRTQWLNYVAGFAAEDLNQQLLSMALTQGRAMLSGLQNMSTRLLDRLLEIGDNIEAGRVEEAKGQLDETLITLDDEVGRLEPSLRDWLNTPVAGETMRAAGRDPFEVIVLLARVRGQGDELRKLLEDPELETNRVFSQLQTMRDTVREVQALSELLSTIPDQVLVSPVATEVLNASPSEPVHVNFYAPAVLALLLQHMAITFGSLTIVRERLLGAEELFRIAPISPWEILTGKFAGYTLFTVGIGIVLSVLLVLAIKIPMLGSVLWFGLTLILLTTAALGWGVFVSLFSTRQSQAVQFSMLLLIASVFFGGFFLALSSMLSSIRVVSYMLPVTYGVKALREIMLAGRGPGADTLLPLTGMSLGFYVVSVLIYTWQNKHS